MFPVKKNIVRIAQLSFLLALITCSPCAVFAQSNIGQNTIVEIREDRAKTSAALLTSSKKLLPRPIIQFLQGENGNTVLVADFNDVVFPFSTRVINVNAAPIASRATIGSAERSGIKLVRIGKFQESPPVCRVAIVSSDPAKLRSVTFDSRPGSLLIKWPKASTLVADGYGMPPRAPSFRGRSAVPHARQFEVNYNPPPVFPATGEMDPALSEIPQVNQGRLDPEIASANGLGLRPAMPAPVNPYNNSRQYVNPAYANQGLAASAQSLNQAPTKVAPSRTSSKPSRPPNSDNGDAISRSGEPVSKWKTKQTAASDQLATSQNEPNTPNEGVRAAKSSSSKQAPSNSKQVRTVSPSAQAKSIGSVSSSPSAQTQSGSAPPPLIAIAGSKSKQSDATIPKVAPDRFAAARAEERESSTARTDSNDQGDQPVDQRPGLVNGIFSKVKEQAKRLLASENPDLQTQDVQVLKSDSQKSLDIANPDKNSSPSEDSKTGIASQPSTPKESGPPPAVFLTQNNSGSGYSFKIVSPDKRDLNFSSFRLHNPERFVIDLEGLRSVQTIEVPQPENTEFLKAIRVGAPDPLKDTGRLVLDLAGELVSVIPGDATSVNEVSFVIGESSNPLVGLSPPPGSVVVLDAGHGGTDPGAQRGYVKEKDLTLAIAKKARDKLVENGVKVVMTRSDDTFVALPERVSTTNNLKPDMFLSVHINSLESTNDIHGIETYYQTDMSKALAQQVHDSLVTELVAPDRAIRRAKFYVINRAEVPAVLAEVGFISNKAERDKLVSEDYQEKIAGALAKGAILYLKQHSSVAAKISRTSDQSSDSAVSKPAGSMIPRASELVNKGLGIKSH